MQLFVDVNMVKGFLTAGEKVDGLQRFVCFHDTDDSGSYKKYIPTLVSIFLSAAAPVEGKISHLKDSKFLMEFILYRLDPSVFLVAIIPLSSSETLDSFLSMVYRISGKNLLDKCLKQSPMMGFVA